MADGGPELPLGSAEEAFRAVALTNAEGNRALLVRDGERAKVLVTVGTEARTGRLLVTPLDDGVEVRRDREAAAQWIASGSVASESSRSGAPPQGAPPPQAQAQARASTHVPAWANVIGLALVLFIFGLTILGALTLVGWLTGILAP